MLVCKSTLAKRIDNNILLKSASISLVPLSLPLPVSNTQQAYTQQVMAEIRNHYKGNTLPFASRVGAPKYDSETDLGFTQELTPRGGDEKESGECCNHGSDFRAGLNFTEREGELFMDKICWEHPVLKDVVMVRGHGPCNVEWRDEIGRPLVKEVVVSRKCAKAGANVFVPGVLVCSLHVENGDEVAVTVAVERPDSGYNLSGLDSM